MNHPVTMALLLVKELRKLADAVLRVRFFLCFYKSAAKPECAGFLFFLADTAVDKQDIHVICLRIPFAVYYTIFFRRNTKLKIFPYDEDALRELLNDVCPLGQ